ncbi:hypothetical protein [Deinococcus rufus]|uniref:Uncharacterized protein n=1 Tax=Deinococcus rufus TaxID=2136097 RepID=A0ABV7Z8R1_9DEIO
MNETIKSALASALTAVSEALAAAQSGNIKDAAALLTIMDEHLELGQGGNAAAAQRRAKILRLEAQTRALLPTPDAAEEPVPADPEPDADVAPATVPFPAPHAPVEPRPAAEVAPASPQPASAPLEAGSAPKVRGVAAPHALSDAAWTRVAQQLRAQGVTAEHRDEAEDACAVARSAAQEAGDRHAAKVAQRGQLQARVEACALRGDVAGANSAWDELFDVVTALRSSEGTARRKGLPGQPAKAAAYEAARIDTLRIKSWARGTGSAA